MYWLAIQATGLILTLKSLFWASSSTIVQSSCKSCPHPECRQLAGRVQQRLQPGGRAQLVSEGVFQPYLVRFEWRNVAPCDCVAGSGCVLGPRWFHGYQCSSSLSLSRSLSLSLSRSLSLSDRFCPPELDLCKSNINRKAVFHSKICSRGDKIVARQSKGGGGGGRYQLP